MTILQSEWLSLKSGVSESAFLKETQNVVWGGGWFSDFRFVFRNLKRDARANLIAVYSHIFLFLLLIILSPCKTKVAVWFIVSQHVAVIFLIEGVVKGLLCCAHLTHNHLHMYSGFVTFLHTQYGTPATLQRTAQSGQHLCWLPV